MLLYSKLKFHIIPLKFSIFTDKNSQSDIFVPELKNTLVKIDIKSFSMYFYLLVIKEICPLRGHTLNARFARSSLHSQVWARPRRAIWSSRTHFLKVTKFVFEFKWNKKFNLLKALSPLRNTFSSWHSRSIFCIHFSNFLINYMIKIIYFLLNISKRKNNRRLYLRKRFCRTKLISYLTYLG